MIGLSRLKRAISDVPPGGMQTGDHKVKLKLCDAQRIEVEYVALISERDAALAQNAEFEQRINKFIESISQLSNQVVDLQNARDDLEQQVAELIAQNADAGRSGFIACYELNKSVGVNKENVNSCADLYAEKINGGE